MINKNDIISELKYCYSNDELNKIFNGILIDNVEENQLRNFFNEHCKKNKITMKISDVFKKLKNKNFAVDTPDGYQLIGDFYLKGPDKFYKIETYDGFKTKCIGSHMFETNEGWKYARDLTKNDLLLTKNGYMQVKKISLYNYIDDAYDFEVLHDNHRYWSGNGISSHNSGKTFLALSICREAQKKGYTPIYMDSEGSIDKAFVERLGIDTKNFIIMQVNTISEVSTFISNLLLKINKDQKIILVLDSLGNLTSDKEKDDIINATGKRDMSKQQEIKALFRTNMVGLAKAHIPFIVNSHVYQTMDLFAKNIVSGGCLTNGNKIYTENGLIDISDINIGDKVLGYDNKYHDVLKTFKFEKPTIKFKFNDGTEIECSHDHKFLVDIDNMIWKKASELNENDIIYSLEM